MNNNPHKGLHNLYLFLGIIVACIVIWQFIAQFLVPKLSTPSPVSPTTSSNTGGTGSPIPAGTTIKAGIVVIIRLVKYSNKTSDVSAQQLTEDTLFGPLDANTERDGWTNYPSLDYAKRDACIEAKRELVSPNFAGYTIELDGKPVPSVCQ